MNAVPISLSPAVKDALSKRAPVVALESTLLAHGMPANRRLDVAIQLDDVVLKHGATPAVIAVVNGKLCAGLSTEELEKLCTGTSIPKCGERDLGVAIARGGIHATTVSSTMFIARHAGIRVFATGGIGGVHRGVVNTFDESQDLIALAHHPVAVVSAGAKAILDLPRTIERLETLGVLVAGWRCDEFPAFYSPHSGLLLEHRFDDVDTLARTLHARFHTLQQGGALVCNPIPAQHAMPSDEIDAAISKALAEADAKHVNGKALTPFLLAALERITGGKSVETNLALALNNAGMAADLAVAMNRLAA